MQTGPSGGGAGWAKQSMASYLSSWLFGTPATTTNTQSHNQPSSQINKNAHLEAPDIEVIAPAESEEADSDDDGYDTDRPPAFPALNSPQRAASSSQTKTKIVTLNGKSTASSNGGKGLMAPPPPRLGASLNVTTAATDGSLAPLATTKIAKKSRKVALAPGHSTLDWANLKMSGADLRGGVTTLLRVTPSMLKEHNKKDDAWTCIQGKVYNMTPYLPYHPGGEKELMRVAGRDGTKLFALTHAWVSAEMMMDTCIVGLMVSE